MTLLQQGRYRVSLARDADDVSAAQALRGKAFLGAGQVDADRFDAQCQHVLIEAFDDGTGASRLVGCFRLMHLHSGQGIDRTYSAQFYDLSALQTYRGPLVEMGRFCVDPDCQDPDIVRIAWAAMTAYVDREGIEMLFGCSSFRGTDVAEYDDAFALLRDRHLAPPRWLPEVKAPAVFQFAKRLQHKPDRKRALAKMPPLLRTYLLMGGWVSDHAVIDRHLGTLHVFTGLEINAVPPARARLLREMAR